MLVLNFAHSTSSFISSWKIIITSTSSGGESFVLFFILKNYVRFLLLKLQTDTERTSLSGTVLCCFKRKSKSFPSQYSRTVQNLEVLQNISHITNSTDTLSCQSCTVKLLKAISYKIFTFL